MEFYQDFLKIEKSKFRIVLGILFVILSIFWIVIKIKKNENIDTFGWIYFGSFSLSGILNIVEGTGISSSKLFGKSFILVNDEKLSIKPSVFSKEQQFSWDEINTINYKINKLIFTKKSNNFFTLQLSKLDYSSMIEIKKIIDEIAKKKGIKIIQ